MWVEKKRFSPSFRLATIRELSRLAFEARRQMRSVLRLARGRTSLENCTSNGRAVWVRRPNFRVGVQYRQEDGGDGAFPSTLPARNRPLAQIILVLILAPGAFYVIHPDALSLLLAFHDRLSHPAPEITVLELTQQD